MKKVLVILTLLILAFGGGIIFNDYYKELQKNNVSNNNISEDNIENKIEAGEYHLKYGRYENISYNIEEGGGIFILNEDGTFSCTSFQGNDTGTYTVSLETYINSSDTLSDWLICFKSSNKNSIMGNSDWIIDGNNQFSGIQDGGTFKYIGK